MSERFLADQPKGLSTYGNWSLRLLISLPRGVLSDPNLRPLVRVLAGDARWRGKRSYRGFALPLELNGASYGLDKVLLRIALQICAAFLAPAGDQVFPVAHSVTPRSLYRFAT